MTNEPSSHSLSQTIQEDPWWSISIDIEGFSTLWPRGNKAILGLRALMDSIYRVGTHGFHDDGDRLFAHQFGDGFIIVDDFHEAALDHCAAIGVSLNPQLKITKGSKTAYADWSDKNGISWRTL